MLPPLTPCPTRGVMMEIVTTQYGKNTREQENTRTRKHENKKTQEQENTRTRKKETAIMLRIYKHGRRTGRRSELLKRGALP